jgi:hypothetical protein
VPAIPFLSLDSLIVSMAIVMLGIPAPRNLRLCAAFAFCDGIATLTGLSIHGPLAPMLFGVYGIIMLVAVARVPWRSAYWAPALFSLDNLVAAMASKPSNGQNIFLDGLTAGITSGLFAVAGIGIATAIARSTPRRWLCGAGLVFLIAAIWR